MATVPDTPAVPEIQSPEHAQSVLETAVTYLQGLGQTAEEIIDRVQQAVSGTSAAPTSQTPEGPPPA